MKQQIKTGSMVLLLTAILATPVLIAAGGKPVVNINTAGTDELMLLPRIGPSVAERIVAFREQNGRFKATEDLLLVRGVGEKTFELIQPHIAVSGETTLTEKVQTPREQSGSS